ncbi:hypothetical protein HC891_28070 [Candidatus Gracilibacteria bacterium]|nr:hypothetical protein [Candidatus Gracilibacteria bacterium]
MTYPDGYNASDAHTFAQQQLLDFVTGVRPASEWPAFVEELNTTYNYQPLPRLRQSNWRRWATGSR